MDKTERKEKIFKNPNLNSMTAYLLCSLLVVQ